MVPSDPSAAATLVVAFAKQSTASQIILVLVGDDRLVSVMGVSSYGLENSLASSGSLVSLFVLINSFMSWSYV